MSGNAHVRTAAAVRTAVLWMSTCMLLQQLGHHPQFTVEAEGSVTVNVLRYFTVSNSVFAKNYGGRADFSNSVGVCRASGGSLVTGQSAAAQDAITTQLREAMPVGKTLAHTYMGGDAMYSVNWVTDPTKVCKRGIAGASLNCIYEWNMGLFTSETTDGIGVAFYRGTLYTVPGAGPVNGYTPFWPANYPAHGQPFMISRYVSGRGAVSTWYDAYGVGKSNSDTPENTYVVVCEVQDSLNVPTTTLPPTPKPASWIQKHWYVPLIIILAALIPILIILIYCCCTTNDDTYLLTTMVIRDRQGDLRQGNKNFVVYNADIYEDDVKLIQHPESSGVPIPMYKMPVEQPFYTNYPSDEKGNVEMPTESKPSKRQRQRGRTAAIVFFEVELPKGEEIKEGDVDTAFEEATKRRRSRSLLSTTKEDDQAIDL